MMEKQTGMEGVRPTRADDNVNKGRFKGQLDHFG